MIAPPIVVLGVSRSGTSLLRHMLDHHSQVAIPDESYFITGLWDRYRNRRDAEVLLDDLQYVARLYEWGVTMADVRHRLPPAAGFADVIQAVYASYAEARGKRRFGDRTPLYMQHLEVLEQAFPQALYVHIVRDGRDAALSFRAMRHRARFSWAWPHGLSDFAEQWRIEVEGARRFGSSAAAGRYLELRYEDLVRDPEGRLREICGFVGLDFEPSMLGYHRDVSPRELRDHDRLREPPSPGSRSWRREMRAANLQRFEAIAGDLLSELRYERAFPAPGMMSRFGATLARGACAARLRIARLFAKLARRTPLWWLRNMFELRRAGFR